ncbi:MAG TPA: 4Fe-4S dicluster domain-containing protein [Gammaproteobacteria bacterium]|nr:4Fe-4S dicluster domain-containing protein [Gammaproteobacteria bacterium]
MMSFRGKPIYLHRDDLQSLVDALKGLGYQCTGPRIRDGAVVYERVDRIEDMPQGMEDSQAPGQYRLRRADHRRLFAWANGPQALKPMTFSPREVLWRVARDGEGRLQFHEVPAEAPPSAVIGVRACDLAALKILDQHYLSDARYRARRRALLLVAVNCTHPAETCFCASTGDGPRATAGFDLSLDELDDGYVVHAGTKKGRGVMDQLPQTPASSAQLQAGRRASKQAAARQTRTLPSRNLRDTLFSNLDHPRWDEVAARCLSCGNCTSVCPTCFCHGQVEEAALDGSQSSHYRQWDSCFTEGHSHLHGFTVRKDTRSRYRQWMTHKLGSWHDQFGRSGCVGCGRCITWCPVGIDITEEAHGIHGGGEGAGE